ncbi:MAG: glycosyltransferase family 4 protein [Alphaproteobacteria bacterium]|nr:glycosyltransferase family 4 protein [Alphaproteobacteria bacterium]
MKIQIIRDIKNILHLINLIIQKRKYYIKNENKVHFITFRKFFPDGGAGGGGAVQSMNNIIFGNDKLNIPVNYTFLEENKWSLDRKNNLWDLYGAIEFVRKKTKKEKGHIYITHDYGSAFGLWLMGKKYALVSHIQGSRVEEKTNFGEKFSWISKKIIQYCEKKAFENAYCVCFPSEGAYNYFCSSPYKIFSSKTFSKGPILYNTLYAYPTPEKYPDINEDKSVTTILSVGQLTVAKGMDLHPKFLEELLKNTNKKIRYIMVGMGILEKQIISELENLKKYYSNFSYIHVKKCNYPQMQYLQGICDIYLMLHRISIFDLATLELMNKSKCIILSNIGGNPEFNQDNNIILVDKDDYASAIKTLNLSDINKLGLNNKMVYDKYFSNEVFIKNYQDLINNMIK